MTLRPTIRRAANPATITRHLLLTASLLGSAIPAFAQDPAQIQRWFEGGRLQQVVDAAMPDSSPEVLFLAAQAQQKRNAPDAASALYAQLAARPASDPWGAIGESGQALLAGDPEAALASAQRAVAINGDLMEAQFQLGLVRARRLEWPAAATAFDRAAELDPGYAYAHYYGGLAHYRANRPDRMAIHFEQFLKAAPEAPERAEVTQIMRTVRGR